MRRVVVIDDLRESEVRPRDVFDRYIELVTADLAAYFADKAQLVSRDCLACRGDELSDAFQKFGLQYVQCMDCLTVYLSPAPPQALIDQFYRDSASSKFWADHYMKDTARQRGERIFGPRIDWLCDIVGEYGDGSPVLIDIKSKYDSYLEAVNRREKFDSKFALNPASGLKQVCSEADFQVIDKPLGEIVVGEVQGSVVTAFEVLERVFSTDEFLTCVSNVLPSKGLFLLTTLSISGFDLQVLWDKAKNIVPLDHINLLSIEGIASLIEKHGFEIIELSTPGQLDVEIVGHALEENPNIEVPRFVSYIITKRDKLVHQDFQEFLQRHRLSSHVRVAARKK